MIFLLGTIAQTWTGRWVRLPERPDRRSKFSTRGGFEDPDTIPLHDLFAASEDDMLAASPVKANDLDLLCGGDWSNYARVFSVVKVTPDMGVWFPVLHPDNSVEAHFFMGIESTVCDRLVPRSRRLSPLKLLADPPTCSQCERLEFLWRIEWSRYSPDIDSGPSYQSDPSTEDPT